jgi:hypothetical protein
VALEEGLGEDQVAVERHLESPATARDKRQATDPGCPAVEELSRQTGGSIDVVSGVAVFDFDEMVGVGRVAGHADRVGLGRIDVDTIRSSCPESSEHPVLVFADERVPAVTTEALEQDFGLPGER